MKDRERERCKQAWLSEWDGSVAQRSRKRLSDRASKTKVINAYCVNSSFCPFTTIWLLVPMFRKFSIAFVTQEFQTSLEMHYCASQALCDEHVLGRLLDKKNTSRNITGCHSMKFMLFLF